jgi:hypothetical protein
MKHFYPGVSIVLLLLTSSMSLEAEAALREQQSDQAPKKAETQETSRQGPGFIAPADVNVRIESDVRTFVVMAALNAAGFDRESGNQPLTPARAEIRRDLAKLDPGLKARLAAFYKSHRREGVDEAVDVMRYAALSMLMTAPPAFSIYAKEDNSVPPDLRPLVDFVPLVREFYIKGGIRELVPKYLSVSNSYVAAYRKPVGELIYETLGYFHTEPQTVITMKPLVIESAGPGSQKKPVAGVVTRSRTRQVFIVPDPLAALGTAVVRGDILNQKDELLARRVGDDYIVIVGPSTSITVGAIRQALIRFVIDPMIERHLRDSLQYKDQISALVAGIPTAPKQYAASVYLVLRESLAQAAEARIRRIDAGPRGESYNDDDATYDLAQAYMGGAALSFHFYESLIGLEKVGISIEDFFDQMLATTKFDREALRPTEFEAVVTRVTAARKAAAAREAAAPPGVSAENTALAEKFLMSDGLIRQRRFAEARVVVGEILAMRPNSARALYGMAQIVNQTPSTVELDPKSDENDKIQAQHDRLEQSIKLYRSAMQNASLENEQWLVQWCHVYIGRILDFQEFRVDAIAEYEKAIAMGDIPNGGYKEAVEGKERPFGQR